RLGLDILAHLAGPGLGAEDADPQGALARVDALAALLLDDVAEVRGRDHDDVGPEIADQLDLLFSLATGHRDHRAAELLGAVVRTQAAGEQPVAVRHVHDVARLAAGRADRARDRKSVV